MAHGLQVTAEPNLSTEARECDVRLSGTSNVSALLRVRQVGAAGELSAPQVEATLKSKESAISLPIQTNLPELKVVETPEWLRTEINLDKKLITFHANSRNTSQQDRVGEVVVAGKEGAPITFSIKQMCVASLSLPEFSTSFPYFSETREIPYQATRPLQVQVPEIPPSTFNIEVDHERSLLIISTFSNDLPRKEKLEIALYIEDEYNEKIVRYVTLEQEGNQEEEKEQRRILTEFYHAMGGDNWTNNTNWLTDAPLHEWYGIQVEEIHTPDGLFYSGVKKLNLKDNNLKGKIPESFYNLRSLHILDLSHNLIEGKLSPHLLKLRDLYSFNFSYNNLSGTVPEEYSNLLLSQGYRLQYNRLEGTLSDAFFEHIGRERLRRYYSPQQEGYGIENL